jgi:type IV secretion system protein VirB6
MSDIQVFSAVAEHINAALVQYINTTATNIITGIKPVSITLVTIFVTFWGWAMLRGMIQYPVMDAVKNGLRISFTVAVATQIGYYNQFVSDWLWKMPDALANLVLSGNASGVGFTFLDTLVSQFYDTADAYWIQAGAGTFPDLGMYIIGGFVFAFGLGITAYVGYLLLLSKIALAVLIGVGAIFVLLTMFDVTRKFFDAWMGQVFNFIILNMLSAAVAGLMLEIIKAALQSMPAGTPDIISGFSLLCVCGVTVFILRQVPSIASTLGGGVAISTLGSFEKGAGLAGGALGSAYKAARSYKRTQKNSIKKGD